MRIASIVLLLMLSAGLYAQDWWYDGYIIVDNKKVEGMVWVPPHSQTTGNVVCGIDLEGFYSLVKFRSNNGDENIYGPHDIAGFSFNHEGSIYIFQSNLLHHKSIIKSEQIRERFLNVVYLGEVSLLRDIRLMQHDVTGIKGGGNQEYLTYYEYYLYSQEKGLHHISASKTKNLYQVLVEGGISESFLFQTDVKVTIRNLPLLFEEYEQWNSKQQDKNDLTI